MEYENLSVDEIQHQLEELDQSRFDLEKVLEERQQQDKYDLVQHIKDSIAEQGYDLSEIVSLLGTKKRRTVSKKSARQYTRYVDPDNAENTYSRGVIPGWMKQKMQDLGYDSSSKEDRAAFKATCMQVLED